MEHNILFNPDGPALAVLPATPSTVFDLMGTWMTQHPEWEILRVGGERGKFSATTGFMNEVAASMQFPYYFGHNWDAFEECVNDLSWLRGASYLIVFDSAQHLLSDNPEDFGILLRILADAHEQWRAVTTDFGARGVGRMAFQSVFACDPPAAAAFAQRMRDFGAEFGQL
ncbi:barstar family protein [Mycolicibacterium sp.]|uniref:barstar family protein n=1 Tax=Mycolicibacterium sp. TaxID=2320850 RepID=UPI001A24D348|nr:barstar family protein [Mycolicibacterium sp.]MBJ7336659.1 barstar family protein [Mycolicibacterium sp.]